MATEDIRELRFKLDWVVDRVARTGEEAIIIDRDGHTERAVIICMADYARLRNAAHDDVGDARE